MFPEFCIRKNILVDMAKGMYHSHEILQLEINKKIAERNTHKDQGVKPKESTETKTPVYVHQFNKTLNYQTKPSTYNIHQNLYTKGFQYIYEEKSQYLKNKFNNLTLTPTDSLSNKFNKPEAKGQKQNVQNSKAKNSTKDDSVDETYVIEKLEENFWANWKPNAKKSSSTVIKPKQRPLLVKRPSAIEEDDETSVNNINDEINLTDDKNESVHYLHKPVNISKSSEIVLAVISSETEEAILNNQNYKLENLTEEKHNVSKSNLTSGASNEDDSTTVIVPHLTISKDSSTSEVETLPLLKHTDSIILTKKIQSQEKSHFQQPKCIKLQKKQISQTLIKSSRNYVKGGSYPLKSCLKASNNFNNSSTRIKLGRPGSSVILGNFRIYSQKRTLKK